MKRAILEVIRDGDTGELGLLVVGTPRIAYPMAATEGLLVAHDLLEHQQGVSKIGSLDDELIALGGVWYIRGQHGDIRRDGRGSMYSPEQNIAADVVNMARIYVEGGIDFRSAVPRTRTHGHDDSFRLIIEEAKKEFRTEMEDSGDYDKTRAAEYFGAVLHYLRRGYRMAARRFGNSLTANSLFWDIARAVDPVAKHCGYEGQRFALVYGEARVRCDEVWEDVA